MLVTHDASVASRADRVIHVRDGLIVGDLDPRWRSGVGAGDSERRT